MYEDDPNVITCKTVGHAWDVYTPVNKLNTKLGRPIYLRCVRCSTTRVDVINRLGELTYRSYRPSKEYVAAKKDRRPGIGTRAAWRDSFYKEFCDE